VLAMLHTVHGMRGNKCVAGQAQ